MEEGKNQDIVNTLWYYPAIVFVVILFVDAIATDVKLTLTSPKLTLSPTHVVLNFYFPEGKKKSEVSLNYYTYSTWEKYLQLSTIHSVRHLLSLKQSIPHWINYFTFPAMKKVCSH